MFIMVPHVPSVFHHRVSGRHVGAKGTSALSALVEIGSMVELRSELKQADSSAEASILIGVMD